MGRLRAQSLGEYTVCLAGIILAALAMQVYVKRGLQGRYIDVAEHAARQLSDSGKTQYEPYYRNEVFTNENNTNIDEAIQPRGIIRKTINQDTTTRSGTSIEQINCYDDK